MATATRTKQETVTFYSPHSSFRLPRVKQTPRLDALGNAYSYVFFTDENGRDVTRKVYEFKQGGGKLTISTGVDVYPDGPDGEKQDAVTWLRRHEEFNHRFFEDGNEPGKPSPSDEEFMRLVTQAIVALDADAIVGLLKQERETFQRPNLLSVADDARKQVLAARQQLTQTPAPEPPA